MPSLFFRNSNQGYPLRILYLRVAANLKYLGLNKRLGEEASGGGMDIGSIVGSIAGGGVGGGVLLAIIGLIKKAIAK